MEETLDQKAALDRAVALAALGPEFGPNPRVGAVITDPSGRVLAEGFHRGAGTPHAEAAALARALTSGMNVDGATAYVSLEPCNHTGRTGPCSQALVDAGIARVVYAVADPDPRAVGGAQYMAARGVDVVHAPHAQAEAVNRKWLIAMRQGRPYVIAKWAQTLDGKISASDGTSFWITGREAREHVHQLRVRVDAILVGTGTVLVDDPELSARPESVLEPHQPLRAIMGTRSTAGARVWRDENAVALGTHDPEAALATLWEREVRTVIVEGGAAIHTAFLVAGLVDELNVYVAPVLLGTGTQAVADLGIRTMADALRGQDTSLQTLGVDCLVTAHLPKG
ncbi:bifunctional diaminohydroxyphosphoribosylaminopyrimidine deaminase/5-amino-6-(5-phosphoribosylamino)uracil reductase RibD [Demequina lutea]|uniref:Riboflavin biosynthesis protein RibD n=1 Tax=Demequina lutea TaxID=431489 RepID=A0A7Z0CK18_9MICO|nr:bifunctional diaminohydroxyphosphoribosylaminopyrimidine deaminase/5-amino-6-(5-phosphoribosylamino)uracil reductase RibD [Demequina lutea]NYI41387.1 diaminohydroxyphosphoribosylaminopyrimidine deaminase/5-amino-6-(5-phosphoribosylamino)uracil reductase [Demequina lutea]